MSKRREKRERAQDRRIAPGLVRVVVVVVVLAVLVPGSLFGLMTSREEARRTTCLRNLMQLGLGLKQYSQDFRDSYPWHVGASKPEDAWCDLAILYPNYNSYWKIFLCPSSKDKLFEPQSDEGDLREHPLSPLKPADNTEVISYAYGMDGSGEETTAWTEGARSAVRLLADKKAGTEISDDEADIANHGLQGRNVGYQDGHVQWREGAGALDPDAKDDEAGEPDAENYRQFWSDPPWFAEGMDEDEEAESAE